MDDTFDLIAQLHAALNKHAPGIADATAWFDLYRLIESDVDIDPRTTKHERELLDQLNRGLSAGIVKVRRGHEPILNSAKVALSALQSSIERRTTGPDGRPLRK